MHRTEIGWWPRCVRPEEVPGALAMLAKANEKPEFTVELSVFDFGRLTYRCVRDGDTLNADLVSQR